MIGRSRPKQAKTSLKCNRYGRFLRSSPTYNLRPNLGRPRPRTWKINHVQNHAYKYTTTSNIRGTFGGRNHSSSRHCNFTIFKASYIPSLQTHARRLDKTSHKDSTHSIMDSKNFVASKFSLATCLLNGIEL